MNNGYQSASAGEFVVLHSTFIKGNDVSGQVCVYDYCSGNTFNLSGCGNSCEYDNKSMEHTQTVLICFLFNPLLNNQ